MTPERERDRLLAEWMGYDCPRISEPTGRLVYDLDGCLEEVPHFSADTPEGWAAMREVVEFVRKRGWLFTCSQWLNGTWEVAFGKFDNGVYTKEATGRLPEAISQAAVNVMEAEQRNTPGNGAATTAAAAKDAGTDRG